MANASLLDEATAAAEAMVMAERVAKSKARGFFVDAECHPQNIAVIRTRAEPLGIEVIVGDPEPTSTPKGVRRDLPVSRHLWPCRDFTDRSRRCTARQGDRDRGADPLALTLLKEPGAMGADIAVGSTQRFGVPVGYGGPHAAYLATRDAYKRVSARPACRRLASTPTATGLPAGAADPRAAYPPRKGHIECLHRAGAAGCHRLVLRRVPRPGGLRAIAQRIHGKAVRLANGLSEAGFTVDPDTFFDTITVETGALQTVVLKSAVDEGINLRPVGDDRIGITLDERTRPADIEAVWRAFGDPAHR
jgi:glycine dehydrogenase